MSAKAYVEHVAIWVRDIHWHIRFFHDVLGMTMREVQGSVEQPVLLPLPELIRLLDAKQEWLLLPQAEYERLIAGGRDPAPRPEGAAAFIASASLRARVVDGREILVEAEFTAINRPWPNSLPSCPDAWAAYPWPEIRPSWSASRSASCCPSPAVSPAPRTGPSTWKAGSNAARPCCLCRWRVDWRCN